MERVVDYFQALRAVVPTEAARMSGAWTSKKQRRYASPEKQSGTGEGPFVETVDWRWDGVFESDVPLVGLALFAQTSGFYWAKSHPPVTRPAVSFSAFAWAVRPGCVSTAASFHGAATPSVPVTIAEEPPVSCVIGDTVASTGRPHVVVRIEGVVFAVVLLPATAIKVGRNRLWRLREDLAQPLAPELRQLMTRGRSGEIA